MSSTSKIVVDTERSNNMLYLPLDQLTRRSSAQSGNSSSGSGNNIDIRQLSDQVLEELRSRQDTTVRRSR